MMLFPTTTSTIIIQKTKKKYRLSFRFLTRIGTIQFQFRVANRVFGILLLESNDNINYTYGDTSG